MPSRRGVSSRSIPPASARPRSTGLSDKDTANNSVFTRIFAEQLVRPELHLGDLAVEVRERVAALALQATDGSGQPAPHEQTPAYYDQTLGGRIFLGRAGASGAPQAPRIPQPQPQTAARPPAAERGGSAATAGCCGRALCAQRLETYCVSSVLPPQFGNSYGPENLFSGPTVSPGSRAVRGRASASGSRWSSTGFARSIPITLRTGYQKNADIFQKNGRVRQLRMMFSNGETMTLTPPDRAGAEVYKLDRPVKAYWIKFTIEGVYPGKTYSDTAISSCWSIRNRRSDAGAIVRQSAGLPLCSRPSRFGFPASAAAQSQKLPAGFVYLRDIDPTIIQDIRYAGANNFTGRKLRGYEAAECIVKRRSARC